MGASGKEDYLSWLFLGTLAGTLITNPIFSALVSRYPRKKFVPIVYHFLAVNILIFYGLLTLEPPEGSRGTARVFFIWFSVFNLIGVSLFWGLMADLFRTDQGKRLFGFISAGGTLGAIAGAGTTAFFAERVDPIHLLLVAAVFLELATFCIRPLIRLFHLDQAKQPELHATQSETEKLELWSGIRFVARSPYLLGICLYLLFYALCGSFLYLQQAEIAKNAFQNTGERTAFFAKIDLYVNLIGFILGSFVTGRLILKIGVGATLAALPLVFLGGFITLGFTLSLVVVSVFQLSRRAVDYSVSKPAREVLFTVVSREEKYTAKNLIDTFVYRFGDAIGAMVHELFKVAQFTTAQISFGAIPIAFLWILNALWLGRKQSRLVEKN